MTIAGSQWILRIAPGNLLSALFVIEFLVIPLPAIAAEPLAVSTFTITDVDTCLNAIDQVPFTSSILPCRVIGSGDGLSPATCSRPGTGNNIAPNCPIPDAIADIDLRGIPRAFDVRAWTPQDCPRFRLRGRLEEDTVAAEQSAANKAVFGNLPAATGFRRARIGAEGHFTPDSRYVFEIDLASGQVVLRDGYIGAGDIQQDGEFKFGHMREPFSLEGGTSSTAYSFMERSFINTLDPARNWGLAYTRHDPANQMNVMIGMFQAGTDASDIQFGVGSNTALTAKATKLLWYENDGEQLMHVGLVVSERVADFGVITVSQKPASTLIDLSDSTTSAFVPTIKVPANFQQLINAQWACVNGSFWADAEWYGTVIDQRDGPPIFYHGSYIDAGYFLTGERRQYQKQYGVFGPISVHRPAVVGFASSDHDRPLGHGAWELTARLSYLDFLDKNTPTGPGGLPVGTTLPEVTVGVNWYLSDRLRVMFNYSLYAPNEPGTGTSIVSVIGTRLAMFW